MKERQQDILAQVRVYHHDSHTHTATPPPFRTRTSTPQQRVKQERLAKEKEESQRMRRLIQEQLEAHELESRRKERECRARTIQYVADLRGQVRKPRNAIPNTHPPSTAENATHRCLQVESSPYVGGIPTSITRQ